MEVANVYDSYAAAGQTELAISNYEKTLELDPENPNAREVLKRLKTQR